MGISLAKGERISLEKVSPGLIHGLVGLGWDTKRYDGGYDFDLDVSLFLVGKSGTVEKDHNFIFYGNLHNPNKSIVHTGDNRTGAGDGDDEEIKINFPNVPQDVEKIVVAVTIHDADKRNQNFGMVDNSYIRIVNDENGQEVIKFDLVEDYSSETAIVAGRFYRHNSEWKFAAVGSGYDGGLRRLSQDYGLDVE